MATQRVNGNEPPPKRRRRATTERARERQLVALSYDVAEEMLRGERPPAQVVTHFLKVGSMREQVELEYKQEEMRVLKIKAEALASEKRVEDLYEDAMKMFRAYSGHPDPVEEDFAEEDW